MQGWSLISFLRIIYVINDNQKKMFTVICWHWGRPCKQEFSLITPSVLLIEQSSRSVSMIHGKIISWNIHKQTCRVPSASSVHKTAAGDLSSGAYSKQKGLCELLSPWKKVIGMHGEITGTILKFKAQPEDTCNAWWHLTSIWLEISAILRSFLLNREEMDRGWGHLPAQNLGKVVCLTCYSVFSSAEGNKLSPIFFKFFL
jgi:hypothetical protein